MADSSHDCGGTDDPPCRCYRASFDQGHQFRLLDRPGTFHVSQAGLGLGNYLVRELRYGDLAGRVLDIGTGSGVMAMLLRSLGATSVAATDISPAAIATARRNELKNFGDARIDFQHGDLFPPGAEPFDLIVFNPPGWRAPSDQLKVELDEKHGALDLHAMFYGDSVLLRFLEQLPDHLAENGRAIVGLNSLVGIDDIFQRSRTGDATIQTELLERLEIPLLFYTDAWRQVRESLLAQFERQREEQLASYVTRGDTIHWFYEITEVTVNKPALSPLPSPARSPIAESSASV
jgi:release factor glutamine methyltransferase